METKKIRKEVVKSEPNETIKNEKEIKVESKIENNESENKPVEKDPLIENFLSEIDEIKTEDFKSSSKEQIERLLRPGSTYFNLNPFEVLQIDPFASLDEIKRKYRKLSMYVHPDKNKDNQERAQIAFEAVNRSYKLLEDEKERKKCLEVVEEAKEQVDKMCEEKRKKLRKEAAHSAEAHKSKKGSSSHSTPPVSNKIDEDDPDKYRHAIYVMTCKLFADIERLKVKEMEKRAEEKKRKAEEKAEEEVQTKSQKVFDKNYEESREGRVTSWKSFVSKKAPTATKSSFFKPPKHKPESR